MRPRHSLVAGLAVAALLAGCGGGGHHGTPAHKAAGALPSRAHVVFASDQAAPVTHAAAHTAGTVEATLHFDPGTDGFSFQNYGFIAGADLDPHAMRELFGNVVCAGTPSDSCTLTPAAQQFASTVAGYMFGGHCYGFTMVSLRFFRHELSPQAFGASTVYGLSLTPQVQSEIAASWASQMLTDVQNATVHGTPSQIISLLKREMNQPNGDPYGIGFRNGDGQNSEGHEVTPIGVANLGGGRYQILIYDNNKPDEVSAIAVDTNQETWSYNVSTNPTEPDTLWSGQGSSNEMMLTPLSATTRTHPCPFCGGAGTAGAAGRAGYDTIALSGDPVDHGHLLVTAADGRRLGFVGNRLVDQIPGARIIRPELSEIWKARPEPIYLVPARLHVTVSVTGGSAHPALPASLHVVGPGFGAAITNLAPGAGSTDELSVAPGASAVSLQVLGAATSSVPSLSLGVNHGHGGSVVDVAPHALRSGTKLTVGGAAGRHVTVSGQGAGTAATVTVRSVSATGTRTLANRSVGLGSGHSMTVGLLKVG